LKTLFVVLNSFFSYQAQWPAWTVWCLKHCILELRALGFDYDLFARLYRLTCSGDKLGLNLNHECQVIELNSSGGCIILLFSTSKLDVVKSVYDSEIILSRFYRLAMIIALLSELGEGMLIYVIRREINIGKVGKCRRMSLKEVTRWSSVDYFYDLGGKVFLGEQVAFAK
jgi:hypothetical protein